MSITETISADELNKPRPMALASDGELYSIVSDVFVPSSIKFAGSLAAIERTHTNSHYGTVLSKTGLVNPHESSDTASKQINTIRSDDNGGWSKRDYFGKVPAEDVHSVPVYEEWARAYGPILQCITGVEVDQLSLDELRTASQHIIDNDVNKDKAVVGSGSHKHHYYDTSPQYLLVPCEPLEFVRDPWRPGMKYSVLYIASNANTYAHFVNSNGLTANESARNASAASPDDLKNASELIAAMVKGLAESASREDFVRPIDLIQLDTEKQKMNEVLGELKKTGYVNAPSNHKPECKVLKAEVNSTFDYTFPDPLLLCTKAAINWHYMTAGMKALPACPPPEDPIKKREIEIANEELCGEFGDKEIWPKTWEDLAKGLGQYCPLSTHRAILCTCPCYRRTRAPQPLLRTI